MTRQFAGSGRNGWIALGATVVIADSICESTMSEAFGRALRHPVAGPLLVGTWAVLTAHLFDLLPTRYDPFHRAACRLRGGCVHRG